MYYSCAREKEGAGHHPVSYDAGGQGAYSLARRSAEAA